MELDLHASQRVYPFTRFPDALYVGIGVVFSQEMPKGGMASAISKLTTESHRAEICYPRKGSPCSEVGH